MREQELVVLLQAHDGSGMDVLLRHYGSLMRYIIRPILADTRDREECLNDVALLVWNKAQQFDPRRGSFTAWLSAITRNVARSRARAGAVPEQALDETLFTSGSDPEHQLLQRERSRTLEELFRSLSMRDLELFYRKYYYLQPVSQIASELGMTPRAVEGRLYRTKQKLRAKLGGEEHA